MSFSSDTKEAICRNTISTNECCLNSEIAALVHTSATLSLLGRGKFLIRFTFEQAAVARYAYKLIYKLLHIKANLRQTSHTRFGGINQYQLTLEDENATNLLLSMKMMRRDEKGTVLYSMTPRINPSKECCKKAFIRGAFLGSGSFTNPNKAYRLDIISTNDSFSKIFNKIMDIYNIKISHHFRKEKNVHYIKNSDDLSTFLALIGANNALMLLQNTIIKKHVLNQVNRAMNCDNSNMNKQLNAANKHIDAINFIFNNDIEITYNLRQTAELRIQYPDISLSELSELHEPPISKSGLNHRLRKLYNIAAQKGYNLLERNNDND